ncbi:hypothetical protein [Cryobacterium soli]|uniref:hypothetical protein n=1 Tax=Cryobacterium soli TaxID=2220095 RepID=UPI000E7151B3|nr:hypothetical protein [Cryobacterium soli]
MSSIHPDIRFGKSLRMQGGDAHAFGFVIEEIEGWEESVDVNFDETPIPGGNGSFDVPVTLASRLVKVRGYCEAESIEKFGWHQRLATGLVGGASTRSFVVEKAGLAQWAPAHCIGAKLPQFGGQAFGNFVFDFWMPKPYKFGNTVLFNSGVPAPHYGNSAAVPVFTIGGVRPSGYTIAGPGGRSVKVTTPVTSGHAHTYDMNTGELVIDGNLMDSGVEIGDSWAIWGGTSFAHTITGGSGDFTTAITETDT